MSSNKSHWVVEDSGKVSAFTNVVKVEEAAKQSTKFNALWKEGAGLSVDAPAPQYFELTLASGTSGVWFGFGDETHLGSGWKSKGFMFGGNLSDGGALMRSNFGERAKAGDVVGLFGQIQNKTLEVYFSLNGKGLGKAFEIEKIDNGVGPLYPLIAFSSGPSEASIVRKTAPSIESMELVAGGARTSEHGEWSIAGKELCQPEGEEELPDIIFNVDVEKWSLGARVANSMSVQIEAVAPHAAKGGCMSTMMMPPPHLQPLEQTVNQLLSSVTSVKLVDGETLEIKYGAEKAVSLKAFDKKHSPVERTEINWLRERK